MAWRRPLLRRPLLSGGWGYPYWGWGWGGWPYYSSWWWGGPSGYVVGGDGYGDGYVDVAARAGRYAIVKTDISPEEAQVFLDGKYIGTADDFDGIPDFLYLGPGKYHLEFRLPNYQTFATDLDVARGQQVRLDEKLKLEPGKSALDQFLPESKGTPLGRVFTKGPDGTGEAAPPPAPRHTIAVTTDGATATPRLRASASPRSTWTSAPSPCRGPRETARA